MRKEKRCYSPIMPGLEINLIVPDLWQQEAVHALRAGNDVVVHAPTGAGKTYIFELLYPALRPQKGQAVFTVPTRALANDKLAEWRARGWDVGIATGDLLLNPEARVIVATLETQKGNFLRRRGPKLLVVDEYQMLGDPVRGVNYELALALAPPETQFLMLSGSVGNPQDVVDWLRRISRNAVLVSHGERPVPLDEVDLPGLPGGERIRSFWPRMIAKAMRADLDPVLIFAPRRNASEQLAHELASALPCADPLALSPEQEQLAGPRLAKLLKSRIAYHHSGLSYALRAGLIEPLAKAGHLRAVVATMGLASGINFSMRSVLVTDTRYFIGNFEQSVRPDELLQMFGRAGRRGLDESGYVLVVPGQPRLCDARPRQLKRALQVDWPSLVSVMLKEDAEEEDAETRGRGDAERGGRGNDSEIFVRVPSVSVHSDALPFSAAVKLSHSLFSLQRVPLGVEHSLQTGPMPCGLWVDAERARLVRKGVVEMLASTGKWEPLTTPQTVRLGELWIRRNERWVRAIHQQETFEGLGFGNLCKLGPGVYGREIPVATSRPDGSLAPVKWVKRKLSEASERLGRHPKARREPRPPGRANPAFSRELLEQRLPEWIVPGALFALIQRGNTLVARIDFSNQPATAFLDSRGRALADPPTKEDLAPCCRGCSQLEWCRAASPAVSPAFAWRRLGLVEADGRPTVRGTLFSFFNAGEGLAVAAALEDESYSIEEFLFDLANLRAGPRFAGDEPVLGGRLGSLCQRVYERADYPGYLEIGRAHV